MHIDSLQFNGDGNAIGMPKIYRNFLLDETRKSFKLSICASVDERAAHEEFGDSRRFEVERNLVIGLKLTVVRVLVVSCAKVQIDTTRLRKCLIKQPKPTTQSITTTN